MSTQAEVLQDPSTATDTDSSITHFITDLFSMDPGEKSCMDKNQGQQSRQCEESSQKILSPTSIPLSFTTKCGASNGWAETHPLEPESKDSLLASFVGLCVLLRLAISSQSAKTTLNNEYYTILMKPENVSSRGLGPQRDVFPFIVLQVTEDREIVTWKLFPISELHILMAFISKKFKSKSKKFETAFSFWSMVNSILEECSTNPQPMNKELSQLWNSIKRNIVPLELFPDNQYTKEIISDQNSFIRSFSVHCFVSPRSLQSMSQYCVTVKDSHADSGTPVRRRKKIVDEEESSETPSGEMAGHPSGASLGQITRLSPKKAVLESPLRTVRKPGKNPGPPKTTAAQESSDSALKKSAKKPAATTRKSASVPAKRKIKPRSIEKTYGYIMETYNLKYQQSLEKVSTHEFYLYFLKNPSQLVVNHEAQFLKIIEEYQDIKTGLGPLLVKLAFFRLSEISGQPDPSNYTFSDPSHVIRQHVEDTARSAIASRRKLMKEPCESMWSQIVQQKLNGNPIYATPYFYRKDFHVFMDKLLCDCRARLTADVLREDTGSMSYEDVVNALLLAMYPDQEVLEAELVPSPLSELRVEDRDVFVETCVVHFLYYTCNFKEETYESFKKKIVLFMKLQFDPCLRKFMDFRPIVASIGFKLLPITMELAKSKEEAMNTPSMEALRLLVRDFCSDDNKLKEESMDLMIKVVDDWKTEKLKPVPRGVSDNGNAKPQSRKRKGNAKPNPKNRKKGRV